MEGDTRDSSYSLELNSVSIIIGNCYLLFRYSSYAGLIPCASIRVYCVQLLISNQSQTVSNLFGPVKNSKDNYGAV